MRLLSLAELARRAGMGSATVPAKQDSRHLFSFTQPTALSLGYLLVLYSWKFLHCFLVVIHMSRVFY